MKYFFFVVVPIVEIVAAAVVAHFVGWSWTILALVVLTFVGAWQVKVQGLAAWRTASRELSDGASPAPAVLDGALRLVGAVLLTIPGFVTAAAAILLLIAPARRVSARHIGGWVVSRFGMPFVVVGDDRAAGWRFRSRSEPDYVDVEGWEDSPGANGGRSQKMIPSESSRY
ncbi:MAG TPA: FxsA family protein [Acidimicrobiales bacterium]|nr:FxsA family protein [Acidimicrobiales bacterium]